jgi:hypothetical protein
MQAELHGRRVELVAALGFLAPFIARSGSFSKVSSILLNAQMQFLDPLADQCNL